MALLQNVSQSYIATHKDYQDGTYTYANIAGSGFLVSVMGGNAYINIDGVATAMSSSDNDNAFTLLRFNSSLVVKSDLVVSSVLGIVYILD